MNYYDNYTFLQKYSAELGSLASDFQAKGSCGQGDTGGYCTFDKEKNDLPIFHYYTQDHLGNNRVVTKEDGTVEQIVHYYPFGGIFNDDGLNTGLQQYKYNGKELDRVAGLNTYDYGARQYFSALPVWDRVDPKCEKYYNISPYAYCANNPVNRIDVDGKDWFYTRSGTFLGSDFKSTDNIIIRELNIKALGSPSWQKNAPKYIDRNLKDIELSVYAYSNIFTDILIRYGYDMLKTGSGKIEVAKTDFINFDEMTNRASTKANSYAITTKIGNKKFNITAFINTSYGGTQKIFSTVSNVVNILGVHEYKGHGIYKIDSKNKDHIRIYKMQKHDPTWKKTTDELKEHVKKTY